jgi:hypothetical protein
MLVAPFLNDQTPIYWAICNIPSSTLVEADLVATPPVLSALIASCGNLSAQAFNDIQQACSIRSSNKLFQLLKAAIQVEETGTPYTITPGSGTVEPAFDFCIPEFPTRMLVEGRIDMRFISECEWLYPVTFQLVQICQTS